MQSLILEAGISFSCSESQSNPAWGQGMIPRHYRESYTTGEEQAGKNTQNQRQTSQSAEREFADTVAKSNSQSCAQYSEREEIR